LNLSCSVYSQNYQHYHNHYDENINLLFIHIPYNQGYHYMPQLNLHMFTILHSLSYQYKYLGH